ncbi:deleted in malignant brain tumors 1 protein-like [Pseudomyrmex gracilis]|uniref:deleted in malignant brain tumors 1 protein-like n=1 Tax=Pseudomyrmex gracilis TaxID=219809 RepID=UPI000995BC13|nr:deleted in malignant brain tumors 1 protein-like [Pseudomyrmex gracilis]XP_020295652.1 deleted in malignant brain tumors 1 protein-like [Pseudomyrmex gracilis]XP_020295654.1 deleted in malignant brain tumors 1 protein-like [Pseudomyrmex gracilis]
MTGRRLLIAFLTCYIVSCVCVDILGWHNRGRHKIAADRRRFWQTNDAATSFPRATKRKWESAMVQNNNRSQIGREKRFFSLFTLVKFDNNICDGSNGENGTCLAAAECSQRGGISGGVCANGYGVCCIVTVSCGGMIAANNTYFVNPNYPSNFDGMESCQVTLVKSHPDVCQYRLDFAQFNIRGPETTNNVCSYDQFIVSGGNPVPTICGNNNGNHMYVDTGVGQTNPVTLTFVTSGSSFPRSWKVRVSQIRCSTIYRAEEGCLQYFTGVSGQIKSFNYDPTTGLQLSNQDYSICIRMERNFCGIQYTACTEDAQGIMMTTTTAGQIMRSNAFTLTGNTQNTQIASMTGVSCVTDWLSIPCATNLGRIPTTPLMCVDRLCGGTFNAEPQNLNASSVISTVKPFRLIFHTDGTEAPADVGNRGFCLNYVQQPCTTRL